MLILLYHVLQVDSLEQALLAALPLGPQTPAGGITLPEFFRVRGEREERRVGGETEDEGGRSGTGEEGGKGGMGGGGDGHGRGVCVGKGWGRGVKRQAGGIISIERLYQGLGRMKEKFVRRPEMVPWLHNFIGRGEGGGGGRRKVPLCSQGLGWEVDERGAHM